MPKNYFINTIFENKILKADGNEFEQLFVDTMKFKHGEKFTPIKATGSIGDKANDGYRHEDYIFYQVYGPEDLKLPYTLRYAKSKLRKDYIKLLEHIANGEWTEIKEFHYVVNDKNKGLPPELAETRDDLIKEYGIPIVFFTSKDLKKFFMRLDTQEKEDVLGTMIPETVNTSDIDFAVLDETTKYILNLDPMEDCSSEKLVIPDFEEKIKFNNLSPVNARHLDIQSIFYDSLEEFFNESSDDISKILRDKFSSLYQDAIKISENSDEQFMYIYMSCKNPRVNSQAYKNSILCLMSYFFASCDIFKEPKKESI